MPLGRRGIQRFTASGELGISGASKHVYGIHFLSGGTAGIIILRNGTAATDTANAQINGTASAGTSVSLPDGLHFPAGCYVSIDANVTYATISFEEHAI